MVYKSHESNQKLAVLAFLFSLPSDIIVQLLHPAALYISLCLVLSTLLHAFLVSKHFSCTSPDFLFIICLRSLRLVPILLLNKILSKLPLS
jgi:hypothetical protein